MNKFVFGVVATVAVVSVGANFLMYHRYSSQRALFEVNDQVIRQKDLDDRVNYLYSNRVLRSMIINDLIMQEATKEGVVPSAQDVADAKAQIERTRPAIISQARAEDPTLELFDQELAAKIALRNIQIKNIKVNNTEVQSFYDQHKAAYMLPAQTQSTVVLAKNQVAADTAAEMLRNGVNIKVIAQTPDLAVVGINAGAMPSVPKDIMSQVLAMSVGDIKTFDIGNMKMVVQPTSSQAQEVPPLQVIYNQVSTDAKLAKALPENLEIAQLVHNAHITVESDKFAGAVPSGNAGTAVASAQ